VEARLVADARRRNSDNLRVDSAWSTATRVTHIDGVEVIGQFEH
jgi:hypothetical protein